MDPITTNKVTGTQVIAVAGAIAYDLIATTDTYFGETPVLNCKLNTLSEAFGGCAGNIAYSLAQLACQPLLLSCSGQQDQSRYLEHLRGAGITTDFNLSISGAACARASVITDPQGQQFTAFYPGPVPTVERWQAHLNQLDKQHVSVFVQAPYPTELMMCALQYFSRRASILKIWAPGQYADQLAPQEVEILLSMTDWLIGNSHEINILRNRSDLNNHNIITTNGDQPVRVDQPGQPPAAFPVMPVARQLDPTGCGDALTAGIASALANKAAINSAIELGIACAAACLGEEGAQYHRLNAERDDQGGPLRLIPERKNP